MPKGGPLTPRVRRPPMSSNRSAHRRPRRDAETWRANVTVRSLLDGDRRADLLEGLLGLLGGVLGDLLQERLGRTVDQVLGLLQAEAGEGAHLLDDLDLLVAGGLEDDVELVLLGRGLGGRGTRARGGDGGDRRGG